MLGAMSSRELTQWQAYFMVLHEEDRHRQDVIDSGDGIVIESGRDTDEDDEDDGEAE
jgi:hypothetical protein